jgi:ligand-binding SRPBCC domain-containing protein
MPTTFVLHARQVVPVDLGTTFAFFADAANLQRLTPPWLDFTITSRLPIAMKPGALIDYTLKVHGVPVRWQSVISEWDPPARFVDEQVRGPYRFWRHEHRFTAQSGGTLVEDDVRYQVLGGALPNLFVRRDLRQIFSYRQQALLDALAIATPGPASLTFGTL